MDRSDAYVATCDIEPFHRESQRLCSYAAGAIQYLNGSPIAELAVKKYLIIGADAKTRGFVQVNNLSDFDEAKIRQLLEKYLQPLPQFEIFALKSANGADFVLFVFPRQKTRRIVAKVTVDHPTEKISKVLIRSGDLWTKGQSTAKRLASAEDWDDIFSDAIELETERRTRQRTAHLLERATAQEKLGRTQGSLPTPNSITDEEFKALLESICLARDLPRFFILLEGLRDELVEGWNGIGTLGPENLMAVQTSLPQLVIQVRDHKTNVFLPAIQRLTSAAIYTIKNGGLIEFVRMAVSLFEEIFLTADKLPTLRSLASSSVLMPLNACA